MFYCVPFAPLTRPPKKAKKNQGSALVFLCYPQLRGRRSALMCSSSFRFPSLSSSSSKLPSGMVRRLDTLGSLRQQLAVPTSTRHKLATSAEVRLNSPMRLANRLWLFLDMGDCNSRYLPHFEFETLEEDRRHVNRYGLHLPSTRSVVLRLSNAL